MNATPTVFYVAFAALMIPLLLGLLASITRAARKKVEDFKAKQQEREGRTRWEEAPAPSPKPTLPPIPEDQTGSFYLKEVFTKTGALALVVLPLILVFQVINAKVLSEALQLVWDRAGQVLFAVDLFGQSIEITDLHLIGASLSIAQFVLGAEVAAHFKDGTKLRWFVLSTAVGFVLLEDYISAHRGYLTGGVSSMVMNGLLGHVAATIELLAGYRGVHFWALPAMCSIGWFAIAPFRAVNRSFQYRKLVRKQRPVVVKPAGAPSLVTRGLARLDVIFGPLHMIDATLEKHFGKIFSQRKE